MKEEGGMRGRRLGMATRYAALVFGAIFVTMAGSAFVLLSRERAQSAQDLRTRADAIVQLVVANSEFAIYAGNTEALAPVVRRLDAMEDVAYVRLLRASGDVVLDRRLDSTFTGATVPDVATLVDKLKNEAKVI